MLGTICQPGKVPGPLHRRVIGLIHSTFLKPQPLIFTLVLGGPLLGVKPLSEGQLACPVLCKLLAKTVGAVVSSKAKHNVLRRTRR